MTLPTPFFNSAAAGKALDEGMPSATRTRGLFTAFNWSQSPQGWDYWTREHGRLEKGRDLSLEAEVVLNEWLLEYAHGSDGRTLPPGVTWCGDMSQAPRDGRPIFVAACHDGDQWEYAVVRWNKVDLDPYPWQDVSMACWCPEDDGWPEDRFHAWAPVTPPWDGTND